VKTSCKNFEATPHGVKCPEKIMMDSPKKESLPENFGRLSDWSFLLVF
jgi:hypothetical protein